MSMDKYDHQTIEEKWVDEWQKRDLYRAIDGDKRPKFYLLVEFPYPSGAGLHVGHARSWSAMDAYARKKRMEGFNVLYPMGWDAFGLPAENYALKMGVHPSKVVPNNIATFKKQCQALGLSFDWNREIDTTDPKYYKWTQWIFVQLFKKGLAYQAEVLVNWCPACCTNLADEEVLPNGAHERCGKQTERRPQKQWLLKITAYADKLLKGLDTVDYSEDVKRQQINWIGKKEGMEIKFQIPNSKSQITVFTTRPDTLAGATFVAVASDDEEVFTGQMVVNPATGEKIPVWKANYVLNSYGTGAVMGVPAYDERDREFALKHKIKIVEIEPDESMKKYGVPAVTYHLRDWVFSRQHYWGEPIPIVHCPKCGPVSVPENQLPVELPYLEKYEPSGTGESPLAKVKEWVEVACPECGESARRETDTMPNWAGSNWYFIRYFDNKNKQELASKEKMKYWLPVDLYQGGAEHITLHLLYSRFIYKFLHEAGVVPTAEPYMKRRTHGIVLGPDGRKMSKSFGNVINPDEIVRKYGADTLRMYEMFMGPFGQMVAWNDTAVEGVYRFLKRVWVLTQNEFATQSSPEAKRRVAKVVNKIDTDIEGLKFNTAVASAMEYINWWQDHKSEVGKDTVENFILGLAPMAPFITEEIWSLLGNTDSIHQQKWPKFEEVEVVGDKVIIVVQVNGKVRDKLELESIRAGEQEYISQLGRASAKVKNYLTGASYREIFVPSKLINFVG